MSIDDCLLIRVSIIGWVSSGEAGLEANAFTGNNSGITIGDNRTPQVVIVSGKDMPDSTSSLASEFKNHWYQ